MDPHTSEKIFNLTPTELTALGVGIALAALILDKMEKFLRWIITGITRWRYKPRLSIDYDRANSYSSPSGQTFYIRLPIRNKKKCNAATNVEVLLEEVHTIAEDKNTQYPGAPMRIRWCHTGKPLYDRLPGGSSRLLDLGCFPINGNPVIELHLGGEINGSLPFITLFYIPHGTRLKLALSLSADEVDSELHHLILRRASATERQPLIIEGKVERKSLAFFAWCKAHLSHDAGQSDESSPHFHGNNS